MSALSATSLRVKEESVLDMATFEEVSAFIWIAKMSGGRAAKRLEAVRPRRCEKEMEEEEERE